MTLIKGISGLRGIVDKGLNTKVISNYAYAFSTLKTNGKILIARDARPHGKQFLSDIQSVFNNHNIEFDNYDIVPTPTAQFLIHHYNYAGGIVVTASHNPINWNGMKFIDNDGCFLSKENVKKLNNIYDELNIEVKTKRNDTINMSSEGIKRHIEHTTNLSVVNKNNIINAVINYVSFRNLPLGSLGVRC